jgi:glycosyltransferase involved in cell wall biosynthesis
MTTSRVVLVSAYYPPHLGGQEVAVRDLANQLRSAGVEVEVATSDLGGGAKGSNIEEGVRVTRLKGTEFAHAAFIWNLIPWLIRHMNRKTIVHLHVAQIFTPEMTWLASKIVRFKYVLHLHFDFVPSGSMGKLLPLYKKFILSRIIRDAALIVVINDEHKREILEQYPDRDVQIMTNGITDDYFSVQRDSSGQAPRLLFVGRLSVHKNLINLLEALDSLDGKYGLDIVGEGERRQDLEDFIAARRLSNVTLHGRLDREAIKSFYSSCSAFILPSISEPQGIVLLEAMACRVPVIVSKVSGLAPSIERAGAGILIDTTSEGIAAGITRFEEMSGSEREQMGDRGFVQARLFSWSTIVGTYLDMYERVASRID